MTSAKALEYRIAQQIMHQRNGIDSALPAKLVDRVIRIAASTAGLVLLGSYLQGLLWVVLAASAVLMLGIKK